MQQFVWSLSSSLCKCAHTLEAFQNKIRFSLKQLCFNLLMQYIVYTVRGKSSQLTVYLMIQQYTALTFSLFLNVLFMCGYFSYGMEEILCVASSSQWFQEYNSEMTKIVMQVGLTFLVSHLFATHFWKLLLNRMSSALKCQAILTRLAFILDFCFHFDYLPRFNVVFLSVFLALLQY